jgi:hypothetical protein
MSGIVRANNTGQSGVVSDVDDDVITFMETPSSANLISALTDETGTGAAVFGTSPTLVTPILGTPQSGVMTNVSGTAASLKAGTVTTNANLTGHVTSSGNAAVLGSFSSAQLATALTNETGTGVAVFATDPVLVTPALGTPSSGVLTNVTGLPTAGIVDNAVTLDKMNSITRGSIIVGNASGNPAALAIGGNTYVLTSDATDIAWAAAAGGIASVVADTSPQLGGNLDMQARLLVGNGGSTGIAISAAGEVTMAAQPCVLAFKAAATNNGTGDGTVMTLDYPTEVFDQNADFASNTTFTAPVTGRYLVMCQVRFAGVTAAASEIDIHWTASNRGGRFWMQVEMASDTGVYQEGVEGGSVIVDMDASDTLTTTFVVYGIGSEPVDVSGHSSILDTYISITLAA